MPNSGFTMKDHPEGEIIHRELDTEREEPGIQIAEAIAEIEGKKVTDLGSMYNCVDGVLNDIFSTPPSSSAQMEVAFNFEGYRITIEQSGEATFVKAE